MKEELNNNVENDANYINENLEKHNKLKKHISICCLNTQSVSSTFDEFQFMTIQTNFDVITLS